MFVTGRGEMSVDKMGSWTCKWMGDLWLGMAVEGTRTDAKVLDVEVIELWVTGLTPGWTSGIM